LGSRSCNFGQEPQALPLIDGLFLVEQEKERQWVEFVLWDDDAVVRKFRVLRATLFVVHAHVAKCEFETEFPEISEGLTR
jgi:hypothetical protein